jgi:hypothetical protein
MTNGTEKKLKEFRIWTKYVLSEMHSVSKTEDAKEDRRGCQKKEAQDRTGNKDYRRTERDKSAG